MRFGHLAAITTTALASRPSLMRRFVLVLAMLTLWLPASASASAAEVQTTWRLLEPAHERRTLWIQGKGG